MLINKLLRYITILLLFFLGKPQTIHSQEKPLFFRSFTTENGLPQNLIGKIIQDKSGFIWLLTRDGLCKYDGYDFTVFKNNPNDAKSISSNFLTDIQIDTLDRLWISAFGNELNCYELKQNRFTRINLSKDKNIVSLYLSPKGYLWMGTESSIYRSKQNIYNLKSNQKLKTLNFTKYKLNGKNKVKVYQIYQDSKNIIWLATDNGMFKLSDKGQLFEFVLFTDENEQGQNFINQIIEADSNHLLIATDNGLFNYDIINKSGVNLLKIAPFNILRPKVKFDIIIKEKSNNYWIGTNGEGLLYYIPAKNKIIIYKQNNLAPNSLANNLISALFIDKSNNLFVGLRARGLAIAKLRNHSFQLFQHNPSKKSLSNNIVWKILPYSDEEIWLGTHSGLDLFNPNTGKFQNFHFNSDIDEPGSGACIELKKKNEKEIFVTALSKGLLIFNKQNHKFKTFIPYDKKLSTVNVNYISGIQKYTDTLLILTYWGKGLKIFHTNGKLIKEFSAKHGFKDSLQTNYLRFIFQDVNKNIWIGSWGAGLILFNPIQNSFKNFTVKDGLNSNFLSCFYIDNLNDIWIGGSSGLCKFNEQKMFFETILPNSGQFIEQIYGIEEDNTKRLWLSSNSGLYVYDIKQNNIFQFEVNDGLQSNEFNHYAHAKTPDGHMLFGGVNGLNYFQPDSIHLNTFKPKILITSFYLHYKTINPGKEDNNEYNLIKAITYMDTIVLNYKQNTIGFEFSALDFSDPQKIKYKYRLKNFKKKWVNTHGNKRYASYTNLSPGTYIFQVQSTNTEGVWNRKIKELTIIINPAFWQTIWFKVVSLLIVLLLIYIIIKIRTQRIELQQKKLKSIVRERTMLIGEKNERLEEQKEELNQLADQLKAANTNLEIKVNKRTEELKKALINAQDAQKLISSFLSNLSHEIRTPMNAINGFSQLIGNSELNREQRQNYAQIINDSVEVLLQLIDDIMSVAKLHSGIYQMKKSVFSVKKIFVELHQRFLIDKRVKRKGLKVLFDPNQNPDCQIYADALVFNTILSNLIDNAIKFTEKGHVKFGYYYITDEIDYIDKLLYKVSENKSNVHLVIFVEDTGIGIDEKDLIKIFEPFRKISEDKAKVFRGTGLGLALVKELSDKIKAVVDIQSRKGGGTKIEITIPIKHE